MLPAVPHEPIDDSQWHDRLLPPMMMGNTAPHIQMHNYSRNQSQVPQQPSCTLLDSHTKLYQQFCTSLLHNDSRSNTSGIEFPCCLFNVQMLNENMLSRIDVFDSFGHVLEYYGWDIFDASIQCVMCNSFNQMNPVNEGGDGTDEDESAECDDCGLGH